MPYDPSSNSSIDKSFSRQAPPGKFRIIGVDTFDGSDWLENDCDTLEGVQKLVDEKGDKMTMMYIYNDKGEYVGETGTF